MSGGRRGFFSRLGSLFGETDPATLRPEWKPPARPPDATPSSPATAATATTAPAAVVRKRVRPPGALDEAAFLSACTRCGRCLEACPPEAIGKDAAGFPTLQPGNVPCALCAAVPCASACPSDIGALRPVAAEAIRIGFARVFDKLCLNHHEAESCENCLDWCPVPGALVAGPRGIPTVVLEHCTGCGACARHCKAYPSAIGIHPR